MVRIKLIRKGFLETYNIFIYWKYIIVSTCVMANKNGIGNLCSEILN